MKFVEGVVLLVLFSSFSYADIFINEVMYDPYGNDNNKEFIEIKGTNNLSEYMIGDSSLNDTLVETLYNQYSNFSLIVEEGFNYSGFNCSVYSVGTTIGDDLTNEGGDSIYLYYNDILIDNITYDGTLARNNNKSLELVNSSWTQSLEDGGTPGRENTGIINDSMNEANEDGEFDVSITISSDNLTLNQTLTISGNITSTFGYEKNATLTLKIARNTSSGWNYKWYLASEEQKKVSNITLINYSWMIPEDFIIGNYKILATLEFMDDNYSSHHKYSDVLFFVNGLEDLGEYNLSLVKHPDSMVFGGIENVLVRFDSNNYKVKNASFVAYIYEPRWASIDLNDNTLMTRPYEKNVAVRFDEIQRGTTTYIAMPLLSKRNCDDDYAEGTYKVKVRLYEDSDDILEETFNITLSGRNEAMCPKTIIKSSTEKSSASSEIIQADDIEKKDNEFRYNDVSFKIEIPEIIYDELTINITINNPINYTKEFEIWSYVSDGRKRLNEESNISISIKENETKIIKLRNDIDNIDSGVYKVFVKINTSQRKTVKSYSKEIIIEKKIEKEEIHSFYIKAKKFSSEITLYANCEGSGILTLENYDNYQIRECNKTTVFNVNINEGNNLFFLTLSDSDSIRDVKKMLISANSTDIKSYTDTKEIYEVIKQNNENPLLTRNNILTGSVIRNPVIYESSASRGKKLIKYLIPTVFIIGIALFMGRKNG